MGPADQIFGLVYVGTYDKLERRVLRVILCLSLKKTQMTFMLILINSQVFGIKPMVHLLYVADKCIVLEIYSNPSLNACYSYNHDVQSVLKYQDINAIRMRLTLNSQATFS